MRFHGKSCRHNDESSHQLYSRRAIAARHCFLTRWPTRLHRQLCRQAVDVLDVASQTNLGAPITVGASPWGLAMAPDGKAYVANFGDGTVSVIDSSTNSVVATLPARSNPEDVTLSTRAQPLILSYQFQAIAPPGSQFSWVRGMNNKGDAVGDYFDSNWAVTALCAHTRACSLRSIHQVPWLQARFQLTMRELSSELIGIPTTFSTADEAFWGFTPPWTSPARQIRN